MCECVYVEGRGTIGAADTLEAWGGERFLPTEYNGPSDHSRSCLCNVDVPAYLDRIGMPYRLGGPFRDYLVGVPFPVETVKERRKRRKAEGKAGGKVAPR